MSPDVLDGPRTPSPGEDNGFIEIAFGNEPSGIGPHSGCSRLLPWMWNDDRTTRNGRRNGLRVFFAPDFICGTTSGPMERMTIMIPGLVGTCPAHLRGGLRHAGGLLRSRPLSPNAHRRWRPEKGGSPPQASPA